MDKRRLLFIGVPLLGVAVLASLVLLRSSPETPPSKPKKAIPSGNPSPSASPAAIDTKPAPAAVIAKGMDDVRLRGLYQTYRSAIATGNAPAARVWLPTVKKEREGILRYAREELAATDQEFDRDVVLKILENLGQ